MTPNIKITLNDWLLIIQSNFWRVFFLIKTCFHVSIIENWIFRHSLVIVFFLGMFCISKSMRWPSQVVNGQNVHLTFMAPIDIMLQKGHSYQKYHLTEMAHNINDTSQKWQLTKKLGAKCESFSKFKNSFINVTLLSK